MPVTQREWDIMKLERKQKIDDIYKEWYRSFLRGRIPGSSQANNGEQLPPPPEIVSY